MTDRTHLNALELKLSNERERMRKAKNEKETNLRKVWITQLEKEIKCERVFLGLPDETTDLPITDEELLNDLFS